MLGIDFFIGICTRHRKNSKNVDFDICVHTWHLLLVMGHKQGSDLAVPVLTELKLDVNIGPQQGWTLNGNERGKSNNSWNIKEVDKYTYKYTDWLIGRLIETRNPGWWEIDNLASEKLSEICQENGATALA